MWVIRWNRQVDGNRTSGTGHSLEAEWMGFFACQSKAPEVTILTAKRLFHRMLLT